MENSKIQWTDHTFNPWIGCAKVSPGCAHCYAETLMDKRWGKVTWGKGAPRLRTRAEYWKQPLKWNRQAVPVGQNHPLYPIKRPRVFCASLADWLDDEVPIAWLADLLKLIHDTPNLDWLLLTKRPENWSGRLHEAMRKIHDGTDDFISSWLDGDPPINVWPGVSVESQKYANERIPELIKIPAAIRFLSCEPLLESVCVDAALPGTYTADFATKHGSDIHWVICGGESGDGARPFRVDWARSLRNQCAGASAFFMKQLGANVVGGEFDKWVTRLEGKGDDISQWPEELRIREFPKV